MFRGLAKKVSAIVLSGIILLSTAAFTLAEETVYKIGSEGDDIVYVQAALKELMFYEPKKVDGVFDTDLEEAVKLFQEVLELNITGVIDSATMDMLKEVLPEPEMPKDLYESDKKGALDWYKKVSTVFPRNGNAKVTDVETGASFMLKRTYGTNHADVEPLTKEDASIIKEIWGGKWTWERRAVVVEVNGYAIAGSMTAYPHAGVDNAPAVKVVNNRSGGYGRGQNLDAVKGNGVDGHMDIHFLNSRTHNTNSVQKTHQDMVKVASEYIKSNY